MGGQKAIKKKRWKDGQTYKEMGERLTDGRRHQGGIEGERVARRIEGKK